MASVTFQELARRYAASRVVPAACALGLFFVWFETAFPMRPDPDAPGFLRMLDTGWAGSLAVAALTALVVGVALRRRAGEPPSLTVLVRRCRTACIAGSLLMTAGSALFAVGGSWALMLVAGAMAGLGMALLVVSWLPAAGLWDEPGVLLLVTCSVGASIVASSMLAVLTPALLAPALAAFPLLAAGCGLLAMRGDITAGLGGELGEPEAGNAGARDARSAGDAGGSGARVARRPFLNAQSVMVLTAFFTAFVVLALLGSQVNMAAGSLAYWLVNAAGLANMALLLLLLRFSEPGRFRSVLAIVLATMVALVPLSLIAAGDVACFVLVKFATFFAFALTVLYVGDGVEHGASLTDSVARTLGLLALLALVTAASTLLGEVVRAVYVSDAMGAAVVAVLLLYAILVAYVLVSGGTTKVMHVITGSFNDETEIARVRLDVLCEAHPEVSARERDVLLLVLRGYSTPRIADKLSISENTAKTHLRHLYAKLGVGSRQQLLAMAEEVELRRG